MKWILKWNKSLANETYNSFWKFAHEKVLKRWSILMSDIYDELHGIAMNFNRMAYALDLNYKL